MKVTYKLLTATAKAPTYATDGAACMDLYADVDAPVTLLPGQWAVIPTNVAFEVPAGFALLIFSRSGHGAKWGVGLANGVGVSDPDYTGGVGIILRNGGGEMFEVRRGDRIAQCGFSPMPRVELVRVDSIRSTARGAGGFGSTGS